MVDLLWVRETEAAPMDTPERRAAFEKRVKDALNAVKDEAVRRHYRTEIDARLAALFAPAQTSYPRGGSFRQRNDGRFGGRRWCCRTWRLSLDACAGIHPADWQRRCLPPSRR